MRLSWMSCALVTLSVSCALDTTDEPPTRNADKDHDGYPSAGDCDDADSTTHPGAEEICDGVDNNCDGVIDEDLWTTRYFDGDQDGYGNPLTPINTCTLPEGFVADAGDCDDSDPTVRPGAPERCAGDDEDCDGVVDNDAIDLQAVYRDGDGDGVGDSSTADAACVPPDGFVVLGGDCDDTDPERFPGNAEDCDGGVDNDCDPETSDAGAVTFVSKTGQIVDLGGIFASGTEDFPARYYIEQPGTLSLCGGEWAGALVIDADVEIVGVGGAEANALDAAGVFPSVMIEPGAEVVSIAGLRFANGRANAVGLSGSRRSGGGLFCDSGAEVLLEDVVITGAEAEAGGGMYLSGCAVTLSEVVLSHNAGVFGGAIAMDSGSLMLIDTTVADNTSNYYAGGVYLYNNRGDIAFSMIDSQLTGNTADFVGALYAFDYHSQYAIDAACTATSEGAAAITGNTAIDLGAVYAYTPDSGTFSSDGCDFGEASAIDDNVPEDVYHVDQDGASAHHFGDGAVFTCAADRSCW